MPKSKQITNRKKRASTISLKASRATSHQVSSQPLLTKIQSELKSGQSYLNLALGVVIVLAVGFMVFNYLKAKQTNLIPAQQKVEQEAVTADVTPEALPGKYTVKEGDTLFKIAEQYYKDGWKYSQLATTNKLADENVIEVGQVLEIPKLEETKLTTTEATTAEVNTDQGTGGATNQTTWGERITGDTYTVASGDWLSTIAGRAYGDVLAFDKIAKANNITDPNIIEPGTVLKIPR